MPIYKVWCLHHIGDRWMSPPAPVVFATKGVAIRFGTSFVAIDPKRRNFKIERRAAYPY